MNTPGASSRVFMWLYLDGNALLSIAQMGPDFILLEKPAESDVAPCNADISLSVDLSFSRWEVGLPDGIKAGEKRVAISFQLEHFGT